MIPDKGKTIVEDIILCVKVVATNNVVIKGQN